MKMTKRRRLWLTVIAMVAATVMLFTHEDNYIVVTPEPEVLSNSEQTAATPALATLEELEVKGRAPRTGYARSEFGSGWGSLEGCDMRNSILRRDLERIEFDQNCVVLSGILNDPYTGAVIQFTRGSGSSQAVQIDHVVALSNAWQTGAQQLSYQARVAFSNDPLNLLAVDGPANQQKGDGDAATWLPSNKVFRCQYIARQIAVKQKHELWVTPPEKEAMIRVLSSCPGQRLPGQ